MKLNVFTLALAVTAFGAFGANAQTVIEERRDPAVVIEHDRPDTSVTVEKSGPLGIQKKSTTVETTGSGDCASKTVHKEGLAGSTTVKKTNCD
jgi:predicted transcriptional regulator